MNLNTSTSEEWGQDSQPNENWIILTHESFDPARRRQDHARHVSSSLATARSAGAFEERERIAREMHDTLLQGLTGIALQLRALLPHVRTAPEAAAEALEQVVKLADETNRDARRAIQDLRQRDFHGRDLAAVVETTARRLLARTSLTFSVTVSGRARPLPPAPSEVAVRIVEEALTNIVKHARAHSVRLGLAYGPRCLRLSVIDDGKGFALGRDVLAGADHWGLLGMQERAVQVGASLVIQSIRGTGTTLQLVIPYTPRVGSLRTGPQESHSIAA
jgi:signal transduction histidine kinase